MLIYEFLNDLNYYQVCLLAKYFRPCDPADEPMFYSYVLNKIDLYLNGDFNYESKIDRN